MGLNHAEIKRLRLLRGLSQAEAAKRAGLWGRQDWSGIESGRRVNITLDVLERIAKALGVKPKDLLK